MTISDTVLVDYAIKLHFTHAAGAVRLNLVDQVR